MDIEEFYMKKEFTASVYLIDNQKVLLIYHHKLQKWLPPGGHVEANETPAEAARREVLEETGLEMEFFSQENLLINCWNAKSIERPYLCLLEEIPPYRDTPAHQHVDFIYVGRPVGGAFSPSFSYQWFSWNDLQHLQPDVEIFNETLQVIQHLFHVFSPLQVPLATAL
jgi:8-oxo-dGTP pyrophosphatase MutT (NUDIX family)